MNYWKLHKVPIFAILISFAFYFFFAYDLVRTDYLKLISLYSGLFLMFYLLKTSGLSFKVLVGLSFLFRMIFILAIPNLSQDFYRFIWDGRLIIEGINPYLYTPIDLLASGKTLPDQAQTLIDGMGALSAGHFSNYPPLKQLCFAISNVLNFNSIIGTIVGLRLIIIAADFGILIVGKKLLKRLKIPAHNIFWYILNPFIIIELTGNLHFEGVMIFFLIWSLYLLHSGKWMLSALIMSASISIKLIPLIFLPLLIQKLGLKKSLGYMSIVGTLTILSFIPFYSPELMHNYGQTIGLWFQKFEFNASLYYVLRTIGYGFRGWNEIAIIGKILPILVLIFAMIIAFFRNNKSTPQLITACLLVLTFYFFCASTVHPWYIATLVILSVFTKFRFPLVWSFVIVLSYFAYININKADKSENLWIIAVEYLIVYTVFIWEIWVKPRRLTNPKGSFTL